MQSNTKKPHRLYKIILIISILVGLVGLVIAGGELIRKENHRSKILAEMALVIAEVQKNPPRSPLAYDEEGGIIQTEADIKATTDEWKMNCLTLLVSRDWKAPESCRTLFVTILKDDIDKNDLTFRPNRKFMLMGVLLLLAPVYVLTIRFFWRRFKERKK